MEKTDREHSSLDDIFVSQAAKRARSGQEEELHRRRAMQQQQQLAARLDRCAHCMDSRELPRHLIIAIGNKVRHTKGNSSQSSRRQSALVKMFEAKELDCVFLETNMDMKRHMVYECIPLPKEVGDMAPIYFKKALLEADEEWCVNKKLVELSSRDVRRAIPKGLPYFSVDFGLQGGFAHVIENQDKFPHYFGK
ncbi:C19L2 protein, partial [Bucco capensis]|nr:C19L2 protein [Bucco capensis]